MKLPCSEAHIANSCWITLGQTVRLAQSIGLHVEQDVMKAAAQGKLAIERRRRVWSSIYCLDRLVSLQLGRPPAIHEDYCNVPRPSRLGDSDIDWDGDDVPANFTGPSTGDYHLALISFSDLLSQALRDLCGAGPSDDLAEEMLKTKKLDQQLLQWKHSLPRSLRFDLGHTFDQSFIFKRQVSLYIFPKASSGQSCSALTRMQSEACLLSSITICGLSYTDRTFATRCYARLRRTSTRPLGKSIGLWWGCMRGRASWRRERQQGYCTASQARRN